MILFFSCSRYVRLYCFSIQGCLSHCSHSLKSFLQLRPPLLGCFSLFLLASPTVHHPPSLFSSAPQRTHCSRCLLLHKINSCPSFLLPSRLLCGRRRASCSLCACRPSAVHPALLLQLSVSPTAYDSQSSAELSSNQSMNFSPSNSAQPLPCFDSGPSPARSSPGASRQVSAGGRGGCDHRVLIFRPVMAKKYVIKNYLITTPTFQKKKRLPRVVTEYSSCLTAVFLSLCLLPA